MSLVSQFMSWHPYSGFQIIILECTVPTVFPAAEVPRFLAWCSQEAFAIHCIALHCTALQNSALHFTAV